MKDIQCYLCDSKSHSKRPGKVRDNEKLDVLECGSCGLVFLSSIDHIDNAHYQDSGMHGDSLPDVSEWLKETEKDDERRFNFLKEKIVNKSVLDFGCGVGGFLFKAKKVAKVAEGIELESRLQDHFHRNATKVYSDLNDLISDGKKYDIITAFHVIEHISDPLSIFETLANLLTNQGELIVEVPSSDDALLTQYKSKEFSEFTYWSQHLYLFNATTFSVLAKKANLHLNWIRYIQRYSLSNHLHWLAHGKPGGHKLWNHLNSKELDSAYEAVLASNRLTDTLLASVSRNSL